MRLTPRSSSDSVDGTAPTPEGVAIKARVRAVPEKGLANEALEKLVAKWLGVPRTKVGLESGGKSRLKSVLVTGDPAVLERLLAERLGAGGM